MVEAQFAKKQKLIPANIQALELGFNYAKDNYNCPCTVRLERRDNVGDKSSGNTDGNRCPPPD